MLFSTQKTVSKPNCVSVGVVFICVSYGKSW
jgi:hypothetical protein